MAGVDVVTQQSDIPNGSRYVQRFLNEIQSAFNEVADALHPFGMLTNALVFCVKLNLGYGCWVQTTMTHDSHRVGADPPFPPGQHVVIGDFMETVGTSFEALVFKLRLRKARHFGQVDQAVMTLSLTVNPCQTYTKTMVATHAYKEDDCSESQPKTDEADQTTPKSRSRSVSNDSRPTVIAPNAERTSRQCRSMARRLMGGFARNCFSKRHTKKKMVR